ncbi:MAG: thioesterase family protein [bacterium]|nr:thioesterase family protein [bacterium]
MIERFKFSTEVAIQISDINYGGHLGNDRYLSLFQEARLRYLKQFGYSEISIGSDTSLIMSQAHVHFKAEAFWGDRLKIFVRISSIKATRFIFDYLIVANQNDEKAIATGYTEMVGFDYQQRKVKRLPPEFFQAIKDYEPAVEIF